MKLEKMVCSLEWSKKLVDAGINVDSYFSHFESKIVGNIFSIHRESDIGPLDNLIWYCPAPIFPELTKLLPDEAVFFRDKDGWNVECTDVPLTDYEIITENTEANVAAAMLIWLKENGY